MTMNPFGIIKGFNILEYQTICLLIITYFKPVQPFPFDKCMKRFDTCIIPVSYTHLDVYKRQAEAWAADPSKTVKDALVEKIAVIGENLNIRRFERVNAENGCVVSYIHGGGRIGVLVVADTDVVNDEIKTCLKNVAMQVAAMSPKYVSRDEVSQEYMDHEKEILLAQAKKENPEKPDNIIEKMIIGRLNKEMKEICLLDQVYVQDSDLTVAKYVDKVAKENNANLAVKKFIRFETGEGIEKKEENFAEEVAKQMAGN